MEPGDENRHTVSLSLSLSLAPMICFCFVQMRSAKIDKNIYEKQQQQQVVCHPTISEHESRNSIMSATIYKLSPSLALSYSPF